MRIDLHGNLKPEAESRKPDHYSRLAELVEEHYRVMVASARSVSPDAWGTGPEDIVQDALMLLLTQAPELPGDDAQALMIVLGYVRNVARNQRRKDRIRRHDRLDAQAVGSRSDPWVKASRIRARSDIDAALERLTESERAVVSMRLLLGMSFREIAHERTSSINTAKELYRRARRKLHCALKSG